METLIVDCDGVLLDWKTSFTHWMVYHGLINDVSEYKLDSYNLPDCVPAEHHLMYMNMFNQTHYMKNLAPIAGAVDAIKQIYEQGFVIKVVTSFSDQFESIKMREQNLINVFGPVFHEIVSKGINGSKAEYLSKQPKDSWYVEDLYSHAYNAIDIGFDPNQILIIPQPYNMTMVNDKYPQLLRTSWSQAKHIILGR